MFYRVAFVAGALILAGGLLAQLPQTQQPQSEQPPSPQPQTPQSQQPQPLPIKAEFTPVPELPLEIYRIDLEPTGSGFSINKPVLEGDVYVFRVFPEKDVVRLPKSRVKRIVLRSRDLNKEVVYQIDLLPTGKILAREEPKQKGATYVIHTWREGTLMSLRQADIKQITRLQGVGAFRAQQDALGLVVLQGELPPFRQPPPGSQAAAQPGAQPGANQQPQGNWIYYGTPGVTDAWAPPSAVVAHPGDVPKAAEPPKTPR